MEGWDIAYNVKFLIVENENAMKAKKQASEGTPFKDDDHGKGILDYDIRYIFFIFLYF